MGKFEELYALNVNDKTEEKDGLTYLAWAWAWAEFKKTYPDAVYHIKKDENFKCYFGDEDIGYMVYTDVTADGITHEMWLPVMDGANKAMKRHPYTYDVKNKNFKYATLNKSDGKYYDKYGNEQKEFVTKTVDAMTMFDVNKTVMRCLVKNIAMFGLGLYLYEGKEAPEDEDEPQVKLIQNKPSTAPKSHDNTKSVKPITMSELITEYCLENPAKTVAWLEGRVGKELASFTAEECAAARAILDKKKAEREAEKRVQSNLSRIDGADLPFSIGG